MAPPDPYAILGIPRTASEEELRTAYRRLVQLHHPDHNNGSHESALRFAEVQEAYAHIKLLRKQASASAGQTAAGHRATGHTPTGQTGSTAPAGDPSVEARLAAMEQELRVARDQREKAARAAAEEAARAAAEAAAQQAEQARAAAAHQAAQAGKNTKKTAGYDEQGRATDEELGYYSTDDSFAKILDDFADQVSTRFSEVHPPQGGATKRKPRSVSDWIDEIGSRLTGDQHKKPE
jgi:curved DNA-binding protein CbpA